MSSATGLAGQAPSRPQAKATLGLDRSDWLLIGGLVLLAAAIRIYDLGAESLQHDEAITFDRASLGMHDVVRDSIAARHTPTYFLLMHAWIGLGSSEALLRAPSAIFGVLTIPLCYALGSIVGGRRVALLAGLLFAISTFQVHYAQEARSYTLLVLWVCAAMLCLVWLVQNPQRALLGPRSWWHVDRAAGAAWLGFALATLGALATHNMALFFLLAANVVFALLALRLWNDLGKLLRNWALAHAVILSVWVWWWPVLFDQGTQVLRRFNYADPTISSLLQALSRVYVDGDFGVLSFSLPLWALLGGWTLRRQPWLLAALLSLLFVSPLAILAFGLIQSLFVPRQFIWSAIPFFALAACGIASIRPRLLFAAALIVTLGEGAVKLDRYYEAETRRGWREFTARLVDTIPPGALVIVTPSEVGRMVGYYLRRSDVRSDRLELLGASIQRFEEQLTEATRMGREIWLVVNTRLAKTEIETAERVADLSEAFAERPFSVFRVVPHGSGPE